MCVSWMCIVLSYNDSVVVFRSKSSLFFRFYKEKTIFCVLTFDFLDSAEEIGEGLLRLNLGLRKTEKSAFLRRKSRRLFVRKSRRFFRNQPYTDNAVLKALLCRVGVESGDL